MTRATLRAFLLFTCVASFVGAGSPSVRAELVAHWRLDEEPGTTGFGSVIDSGPEEFYDGTPVFVEGPSVVFGLPGVDESTGTCAAFSGTPIDVPYDPMLNPESFTFCVWAKAYSIEGYQSVVTSRDDANPALSGYIIYNDIDGNWNFWTGRSGGWDQLVGGPVVVDTWTHLAISFDADTGTKTIYVDGSPVSSDTQLYVPNPQRDFHLGVGGDFGTQYPFDGELDEPALWNVALEASEVVSVLNEGVESVQEDLVAYWKLDEPEGTMGVGSVIDSSGEELHGNLPGPPFDPGRPGAREMTGTSIGFRDATVDVPWALELNPESFTVTAWVLPETTAGYQSVITSRNDIGPGVETQGYIIYNDIDGNWAFWTGHGAADWPKVIGPPVEPGVWQHLAITYDAATGTKALFVNGAVAASATDQGYVPNALQDLHIGAGADLGDQFRFQGNIDDVGLWDEALTEEQILVVMEEGVTGEPPDPVTTFRRGDADASGTMNITDGIYVLNFLFLGGPDPVCADAADADDSETINITDGIYVLNFLFLGGPAPADPFDDCGGDPEGEALDCESFPPCEEV